MSHGRQFSFCLVSQTFSFILELYFIVCYVAVSHQEQILIYSDDLVKGKVQQIIHTSIIIIDTSERLVDLEAVACVSEDVHNRDFEF